MYGGICGKSPKVSWCWRHPLIRTWTTLNLLHLSELIHSPFFTSCHNLGKIFHVELFRCGVSLWKELSFRRIKRWLMGEERVNALVHSKLEIHVWNKLAQHLLSPTSLFLLSLMCSNLQSFFDSRSSCTPPRQHEPLGFFHACLLHTWRFRRVSVHNQPF